MAGKPLKADVNGLRWCSKCREWLPLELFWSEGARDRRHRLRRQCRGCMRRYGSEWWRKNKSLRAAPGRA